MKTIKLGQRIITKMSGEFIFVKIYHQSYGLVSLTESFFGQDYFVDEYLDGFTKEQCMKMLDCCYEDSILIPQNVRISDYFNNPSVSDIKVGEKFIVSGNIYTKIDDWGLDSSLAWGITEEFVVVSFDPNEDVIKRV